MINEELPDSFFLEHGTFSHCWTIIITKLIMQMRQEKHLDSKASNENLKQYPMTYAA
jgi:hypothetical protein